MRSLVVPIAGWVVGMALAFHAVIASGFGRVPGGPGDPRLVHYALEHGYRWLTRDPLHLQFWSPPIFFPQAGTAAYTDVLLGVGPFYWIWRWVGLDAATSFQLWTVVCWSLNYALIVVLLRRYVGAGAIAATLAGVIYAFGSARVGFFGHPQLVPHVWVLISLMAALEFFDARGAGPSARRSRAAVIVFVAALALQAWTAMYMFMFVGLAYLAAGFWAAVLSSVRRAFLRRLRECWGMLLVGLALGLVLLWPLFVQYLQTGEELGARPYRVHHVGGLSAWLLMGSTSWMYGWLQGIKDGASLAHDNGIGMLCLALMSVGLWRHRRRTLVALLLLSTASIMVLTVRWPGGASAWRFAREIIPGGTELRAVGRVGMLLLVPAAVGLALFFGRPFRKRRTVLVGVLMLICVAEQFHGRRAGYDMAPMAAYIESIAARIPTDCEAFLLVSVGEGPEDRLIHDDAEWASLLVGIPTINGRYGHKPRHYSQLAVPNAADEQELAALRTGMEDWLRRHGRDPSRSFLVTVPAGARPVAQ